MLPRPGSSQNREKRNGIFSIFTPSIERSLSPMATVEILIVCRHAGHIEQVTFHLTRYPSSGFVALLAGLKNVVYCSIKEN